MNYIECNLFNEIHITPLSQKRLRGFAPREELADPSKLLLFVENSPEWEAFEYNNFIFSKAWAPWSKQWSMNQGAIKVESLGFFVLVQKRRLFTSMKDMLNIVSVSNLHTAIAAERWLMEWWGELFVISSTLLLEKDKLRKRDDSKLYCITNLCSMLRVPLCTCEDISAKMLDSLGYTVCNGLTLFLAMVRIGKIPCLIAEHAITKLVGAQGGTHIQSTIAFPWVDFVVAHSTPHVADHPWMYACMGRQPSPARVCNALMHTDDALFVPEIGMMKFGFFTNTTAALLAHRPNEMYWPSPPPSLESHDTYRPDIASMVLGAVATRKKFAWWCSHKELILKRSSSFFESKYYALDSWLQPILHFYTCAGEHTPRLKCSRLRKMWLHVILTIDPRGAVVPLVIREWILQHAGFIKKKRVTPHYFRVTMPFAFLKDMLNVYGSAIDLWAPLTSLEDAPCNRLIDCFRAAPIESVYGKFLSSHIEKRVLFRLLAVQRAFGLRITTAQDYNDTRTHAVGTLLTAYLRDNRYLLVV